jgi:hypothetical protein
MKNILQTWKTQVTKERIYNKHEKFEQKRKECTIIAKSKIGGVVMLHPSNFVAQK